MTLTVCNNCRKPYPEEGVPYRCLNCGGVFEYLDFPEYLPDRLTDGPGIWQFRAMFGLDAEAPTISLGEGNTPLIPLNGLDGEIYVKCEYQNPTGSYKDRGAAVLMSFFQSRGVTEAIEDSSGNAGAAFAAYAARSGIRGRIYIPDGTSGPKRLQIEKYGVEVVRILGARSIVADHARQAAASGIPYASHAYLPHVLPGYATIAYEIYAQLGRLPGAVIVPTGQGNLLVALTRGFGAIQKAEKLPAGPVYVGVQAQVCAPLWALHTFGPAGLGWVSEAPTVAEGVRVRQPVRGDEALRAVESSGGFFVAVAEENILPGRDQFAHLGFYVEPTTAIVWDALRDTAGRLPEPVVAILTGSGLKSLA
jgi:threonine synthase